MIWPTQGGRFSQMLAVMNLPKMALFSLLSPGRLGVGRAALAAGLLLAGLQVTALAAASPASPYRGLWVGQVTLNYANEVPVPLDKNNVPIAPDPKVATPTADQAQLRIILHVDAAGQTRLLRDVAVLARTVSSSDAPVDLKSNPGVLQYSGSLAARESDMSLVTDERLYGEFPPQPAQRIASAVYDFGEDRATTAVQRVIEEAAAAAAKSVLAKPGKTAEAETAATNAGNEVVNHSDVATRFASFLSDDLKKSDVDDIALAKPGALSKARNAAEAVLEWSEVFSDVRASNMVEAVNLAAVAEVDDDARKMAAQNTAAAHADLDGQYPRYLAGWLFGKLLTSGAAAAGAAAVVPGATAASIAQRVNGDPYVRSNRSEAITLASQSLYRDTRAPDAVSMVVDAIVAGAAARLPADAASEASVAADAEAAGRKSLAEDVNHYLVPAVGPTPDYNAFVVSAFYADCVAIVAKAAAEDAVEALFEDPFLTLDELTQVASDAATDALRAADQDPLKVGLQNAYTAAAQAARRELPLSGEGFGEGDPRLSYDIKTQKLPALGAAGLEGTVFLPASHPTNPFRHRKHPDHRYGFDVSRLVRLDFDGTPGDALERAGYGVDRISGVYREEIFGLHKPLGPQKNVGLRVEGSFQLNRISHIDALNAPSSTAVP